MAGGPVFCWHYHHGVLVEILGRPGIEERVALIRAVKPAHEIELRIRLMKLVRGSFSAELVVAIQTWQYTRRVRTWQEAEQARRVVFERFGPEIEALHKLECPDCPWNGETIFPKAEA